MDMASCRKQGEGQRQQDNGWLVRIPLSNLRALFFFDLRSIARPLLASYTHILGIHPLRKFPNGSWARQGQKFFTVKNPEAKKRICIYINMECAQGHRSARCLNRVFCAQKPAAVPSGGGVLVASGCVSVVRRWW